MLYLADFLRIKSQKTASQIALGDLSEEVREEPGWIGILQQKSGSSNIERLLLIKENQTSQVNEFSAFLGMGRCESGLIEVIPLISTLSI